MFGFGKDVIFINFGMFFNYSLMKKKRHTPPYRPWQSFKGYGYEDGTWLIHARYFWTKRLLQRTEWKKLRHGRIVCCMCHNGSEDGELIETQGKYKFYIPLCERCYRGLRKGSRYASITYHPFRN